MKKSYIYLIIFEIVAFSILLLNACYVNFLSRYNMMLLLIILLVIFSFIFGLERDRNYYSKNICLEIIISLLIFFILFYSLGIFIGFSKIDNYYSITGLTKFVLPVIVNIIIKEILRYGIIKKVENNKILIILTYLMFVLLDLTNTIYFTKFNSSYAIFVFFAKNYLPILANNFLAIYISIKSGYKPIIIYLLTIELYRYLIPIVPNPNEYFYSLIFLILPIVTYLRIDKLLNMEKDKFKYNESKTNNIGLYIGTILIIICLAYFTSGYFKYYAIAIASGSMESEIYKGDVVVIEKINNEDISKLEVGQILAFKYEDVIVVHRLVEIKKDNQEYYFYTKGDANLERDKFVVKENMIIGIVNIKIPYIGLPTVWFSEM